MITKNPPAKRTRITKRGHRPRHGERGSGKQLGRDEDGGNKQEHTRLVWYETEEQPAHKVVNV